VTILRTVEFWPQIGFANAPWEDGPDEDAFVRSARALSELYSEGIRQGRVDARNSQLRLHCVGHEHGRAEVQVTVFTEQFEGFDMVGVSLPDGVAALSGPARAALVLDVMHAAAVRMADARGWNKAAFEVARSYAVANDLQFRWAGPGKSAPGRRHTARAVFTIADDGFGRVIVEIRRVSDSTLVGASVQMITAGSQRSFRRVARSLRWQGRTSVQIDPGEGWTTTEVEQPPAINVRAEGANWPESGPHISVIGGYGGSGIPELYSTTLHALLERLTDSPWLAWWSPAPDDVLEITYDSSSRVNTARITARRGANKLRMRIERPRPDILAAGNQIALARDDVEAMLNTAQRRAGLGPHPQLPDLAALTAATQELIDGQATLIARIRALLESLADRLPARLRQSLNAELDEAKTDDTIAALRNHLAHLAIAMTDEERTELADMTTTQR
jgi:hypothetical protein